MQQILYIIVGFVGGIASGLFGIGGGVIMIPSLIYLFKLTQHQAQGTTLAIMLPPIGLLAAMRYFQEGHVNVPMAAFVALGFFCGGYFGAHWVQAVPDMHLGKTFGVLMVVIGVKMILGK